MANNDYQRPNPDVLLQSLNPEDGIRHLGKLRIFLGYAAGVGKTYAMLQSAQARLAEGADIVVAYIETHGRAETDALLEGLEQIPRHTIHYRGVMLSDMDTDAVLARRPQIALVDELAHSNIPESRHLKRYQDVEDLLDAGIDVYTTLNVQHIESLNDVIEQITGVTIRETVPDSIIQRADDIELIDILPADLLQRLDAGKVYVPDQAQRALKKFFRPGNLAALRELSMRQAANRVDRQMRDYMQIRSISGPWAVREHIMVAISPSPLSARLIRSGYRMAQQLDADFLAVYIENPTQTLLDDTTQKQVNDTLRLAEDLGAKVLTVIGESIPDTLIRVAQEHNVTKIVVGQTLRSRLQELLNGSVINRLIRMSGDIDVFVMSSSKEDLIKPPQIAQETRFNWKPYLIGIIFVVLATLAGTIVDDLFNLNPTNLIMIYLLAIVVASVRYSYGVAAFISLLSVVVFNFSFVPPRYTFRVADAEYIVTFIGLGSVGLFTAYLASRARRLAIAAQRREQQTARLYSFSQDLATTVNSDDIFASLLKHTQKTLDCEAAIFLSKDNQLILESQTEHYHISDMEYNVATWVYHHDQHAGKGTSTLPSAIGFYMLMKTAKQALGVMGIQIKDRVSPEHERLLDAFLSQCALALEATQLSEIAQEAELLSAKEKLQTTILNSVSHDLRTPLVSIKGTLSSLLDDSDTLTPAMKHELLLGAYEEADRLNRLVGNLLDMSRLQSGAMQLKRELYAVDEIISVSRRQLKSRLENRVIEVKIEDGSPLLNVDMVLFAQVLVNLLDNAVKYSPVDSPIAIRVFKDSDNIYIIIEDQGIGIPEAEIDHIFDKFFRASTANGAGGSGLGLSIVQGIVDLHHGTITVKNRDTGGTIFSVSIPLSETLAI